MKPPKIPSPKFLRQHFDLRARRGIGQHFMTDARILNKIVSRAAILADSTVVYEVGAGPGYLTAQLVAREPRHIVAMEMDDRFMPLHQNTFGPYTNVSFFYGDVLDQDFSDLLPEETDVRDIILVGNIPYQITSPLLFKIWEGTPIFRKVVLTMQKEVAERLVSPPGIKSYGLLALKAQYFCQPQIEFEIPRYKFNPAPRVDSAVVSLKPHAELRYPPDRQKKFFSLLDGAFSQRRKTIVNSITGSPPFPITKDLLLSALEQVGIDPSHRAEKISLDQFYRLFEAILVVNSG